MCVTWRVFVVRSSVKHCPRQHRQTLVATKNYAFGYANTIDSYESKGFPRLKTAEELKDTPLSSMNYLPRP